MSTLSLQAAGLQYKRTGSLFSGSYPYTTVAGDNASMRFYLPPVIPDGWIAGGSFGKPTITSAILTFSSFSSLGTADFLLSVDEDPTAPTYATSGAFTSASVHGDGIARIGNGSSYDVKDLIDYIVTLWDSGFEYINLRMSVGYPFTVDYPFLDIDYNAVIAGDGGTYPDGTKARPHWLYAS